MSTYFPSQIVECIDRKFPEARGWSGSKSVAFPSVGRSYAPVVAVLLSMIDNIPPRLLTLRGDNLAEFSEAVESIRLAIKIWDTGKKNYSIQRISGRENWHPFTLIRKHFSTLSDESTDPGTTSLSFISDQQFFEMLRRDITATNSALDNGEWKAATVLSGSVIEALLLDAVKRHETRNPNTAQAIGQQCRTRGSIQGAIPTNIDVWSLHQLIEVTNEMRLISSSTASQCRIAKDFRNLVHPGRAVRMAQTCDRATALSAVASLEHVIRDLSIP